VTEVRDDDVLLRLEGVTKVYSGTVTVKQADFDVRRGAVNVLVGENGAGKSTLMKIIAGVESPTAGRILLEDKPVVFTDSADAAAHGGGIVFQELNLFANLSVAENIFAARELTRGVLGIDHGLQERRAAELLERLEAGIDQRAPVEDLRIGQQQLVEIAKAVAQNARILILDEPTSALSAPEVEVLFRIIGDLKSRGVAIVYISHRLEELIRIGDFITVLRDGHVTGQERMANVDAGWIVRQMIRSASRDYAKTEAQEIGEEAFRAEDICLPARTGRYEVDHVNLSVRKGEILGVYGLMGAASSLIVLTGRRPLSSGQIFIDGELVEERGVTGRIRRGLALIPEDRQREGLVSALSVEANLTMASLHKFVAGFHIVGSRERDAIKRAIRDLTTRSPTPLRRPARFSRGNQQKVVIGKVLLMDEPSRGIDVGAKAEVFRTMRKLAARRLGIIFVTSDLDEVLALSDMSNGRATALVDRVEATESALVSASSLSHGHQRTQPMEALG
jgi:erythritol transport system ATP-binding protein